MKTLFLAVCETAVTASLVSAQTSRSAPAKDAPAPNYSRGAVLQTVGEFPIQ